VSYYNCSSDSSNGRGGLQIKRKREKDGMLEEVPRQFRNRYKTKEARDREIRRTGRA